MRQCRSNACHRTGVDMIGPVQHIDTRGPQARRRRIGGVVVISVAVRRDGSVEQTRIIQSSGIPLLDSTAQRIVQLASPFPPLPETAENVDILHVTRTWRFLAGGEVRDE